MCFIINRLLDGHEWALNLISEMCEKSILYGMQIVDDVWLVAVS